MRPYREVQVIGISAPDGYITVTHGHMTINVPRDCFRGADARLDKEKAKAFGELTMSRYPWITQGSLDVLFNNARREYLRILDEESGGKASSRRMEKSGDIEGAIAHLRERLEEDPENPDTWYALGELLCKAGRTKEGYEAFAEGRKYF